LSIICILMLVSIPVREEMSDFRDIYGQKKRAKYRAVRLQNTINQCDDDDEHQMQIVYDQTKSCQV